MIEVLNGGGAGSVEEAVLFPFDDHSIPYRAGLRLQLVPGKTPYNMNPIVLGRGEPGAPDDAGVTFYGTVIEIDGELRMWYQAKSSQDRSGRRLAYAVSGTEKPGRSRTWAWWSSTAAATTTSSICSMAGRC